MAGRRQKTVGEQAAVIYCRVSSNKQEEKGTSLESQEAACVKHAESMGYHIGRVVKESFTGAELWDRPLLSEVRAAIKAGEYQALVFYAIDRLSRDIAHLAIIADEVERAGAKLSRLQKVLSQLNHFVSQKLPESTPAFFSRSRRLISRM